MLAFSALFTLLLPLSVADTGTADTDSVTDPPVACTSPTDRLAKTLPRNGQVDVPRSVQPVVVLAGCPVASARTLFLWHSTDDGLDRIAEQVIDPDPDGRGRVVALELPASALTIDSEYVLEVRGPDGSAFTTFTTGTAEETFTPPAPLLAGLQLELQGTGTDVEAFATTDVLQTDGLVALFPTVNLADAEPTSLDALYDVALVSTSAGSTPTWGTVFSEVRVPLIEGADPRAEHCYVARHRSLSGHWSEPSIQRCAVPFDPLADPVDTGFFDPVPLPSRGCAVTGAPALGSFGSFGWIGVLAGIPLLFRRRISAR